MEAMKFVLATHNPGKLREMSAILSHLGVEVVSPGDRSEEHTSELQSRI